MVILTLAGLLLASGCGFHLRGEVDIPDQFNPMFIKAPGGSQVRHSIIQQLQGSQVKLAASQQEARLIVRILSESRGSRVVAVDRNGKALANELHYHVGFDAVTSEGKQLIPPQTFDLVRAYNNPDVEVLGKQLEASLIYEDLIRESGYRILTRLRALLL